MKRAITFWLCFLATASQAQLLTPYLQGNSVNDVACDPVTGDLWFAASNGLWRFNRQSFQEIRVAPSDGSVSPNAFNSLLFAEFDGSLRLMAAAGTSLGVYASYGATWRHLTADSGLPSNNITSLAIDGLGRIWFGSGDRGVGLFDGMLWHRIRTSVYEIFDADSLKWDPIKPLGNSGLPAPTVYEVYPDTGGAIWIGTSNGAARFTGNLDLVNRSNQWCYFLRNADYDVQTFQQDAGGGLWAGTLNNGAFQLDPSGCPLGRSDPFSLLADTIEVRDISLDYDGNLWFATNTGVYSYHPQKELLRRLDFSEIKFIQTVFIDPDNNLWLGQTQELGVLRLNNNWQTFDDFPSSFIYSLYLAHDTLWVGSTIGLQRFKEEQKIGGAILQDKAISALAPDHLGNVWVGVFGKDLRGEGIYLYSRNGELLRRFRIEPCKGLNDDRINALAQRGDTLCVATYRGVNRFILSQPDSCWRYYTTTSGPPGLIDEVINAIAFDLSGRLWCGTSAGLSVLDAKGENWIPPAEIDGNLSAIDGITAISVHPQNGEIWLGTGDEGVYVYSNAGLAHFDRSTVLPDNFVTTIAFSDNNEVWVATRNGVARRDAEAVWGGFTQSSGLASNFVQSMALQDTAAVWFGTWGEGVTLYRAPPSLPNTHLETRLDITDKSEVIYYFSATDLNTTADEFRYRYWLDNNPPSLPTFNRFAVVQVPEPGPHAFHVQAIDRDGNIDRTEATDFFTRIDPELGGFSYTKAYFSGFDTVLAKVYWPPYMLAPNTEITITPVTPGLNDSTFAFDFSSNSTFEKIKPITVSFSFKRNNHTSDTYAIWQESPLMECRGGTVEIQNDSLTIKTTITQLGRYSLRPENCETAAGSTSATATAQPRIFSPAGNGHGPETTLSFQLQSPANVLVKVYNIAGRLVKTVWDQHMNAGLNAVAWNGRDEGNRICPSGLYLMVMESSGFQPSPPKPVKVMILNE